MMITLDKSTGINLKKGTSIKLEKNGTKLQHICVGLNWGAIERKGMLGSLLGKTVPVDLDGAVTTFAGTHIHETIYFRHLFAKDGSIRHSGDDLTGDLEGDDGLDNEVITIDLNQVSSGIDTIFIYLNSYNGQDFGDIPYSKLRIYEGDKDHVDEVLATFNLSVEDKFKGYVSMVMGKLVRSDGGWKFTTIGEPVKPKTIPDIAWQLKQEFLR
ncbi:MAG: tellurium resistance TerZ family protein [Cyclobacteriaceae bacterium]